MDKFHSEREHAVSDNEKYDLVLTGGRVIDPAQNTDAILDVAVASGAIAAVAPNLGPKGLKTIDCAGKIVTPGLIDEHAHLYTYSHGALPPDYIGVESGVATVVDGGSSGYMNYQHFRQFELEGTITDSYVYLCQNPVGQAIMPEIWSPWRMHIDYPHLVEVIKSDPKRIIGLKARAIGPYIAGVGIAGIEKAREVCERCGIHLAIHLGIDRTDDMADRELDAFTRELIRLMAPGDILTHVCTGKRGGIFRADGMFDREIRDAYERGVVFDCCFGATNFSAQAFRDGREHGFLPQIFGTDLSPMSTTGKKPNLNIGIGVSKLLALGMELPAVVDMITRSAAKAIRMDDRKGSLAPGRAADITVSEVAAGDYKFLDGLGGEVFRGRELFMPRQVFIAGKSYDVVHSGGPSYTE